MPLFVIRYVILYGNIDLIILIPYAKIHNDVQM